MPTISVVIPLYNKEELIQQTLLSVIKQNRKADEIIVVDDGSTDKSCELVEKMMDEYPDESIFIYKQKNQGVSVARNFGIQKSATDFVCLLDADDIWKEGFISKIHDLIATYPKGIMFCLGHEIVTEEGVFIPKHGCREGFEGYVEDFFKSSLSGSVAKSSKVCVKRNCLLSNISFPEGVTTGEDLLVWIKLALVGKVVCNPEVYCTVNQFVDDSRGARVNSLPYPIEYYSIKTNKMELGYQARNYVALIGLKHCVSSLLAKDFYLFLKRWKALFLFSPIRAILPLYVIHYIGR